MIELLLVLLGLFGEANLGTKVNQMGQGPGQGPGQVPFLIGGNIQQGGSVVSTPTPSTQFYNPPGGGKVPVLIAESRFGGTIVNPQVLPPPGPGVTTFNVGAEQLVLARMQAEANQNITYQGPKAFIRR